MLFTDSLAHVQTADLLTIDTEVADVADAQGIMVSSTISDAQAESAELLMNANGRFLGRTQPVFMPVEYGVMSLYSESANRPRVSLSQIVMTDSEYPAMWSSLKRWLVYKCLALFYRNASRRADVDRYKAKQREYQEDVRTAYWPRVVRSGIPIVGTPIPRPGATLEPNVGTWSSSNVSVTHITGTMADYDVAISWFCANQNGANESDLSDAITVQAASGDTIHVDISGLNPPNGKYHTAAVSRIAIKPGIATTWRLYAGVSGGTLFRQAETPIGTTAAAVAVPLTGTIAAGVGQWPDLYFTLQNVLFRG